MLSSRNAVYEVQGDRVLGKHNVHHIIGSIVYQNNKAICHRPINSSLASLKLLADQLDTE